MIFKILRWISLVESFYNNVEFTTKNFLFSFLFNWGLYLGSLLLQCNGLTLQDLWAIAVAQNAAKDENNTAVDQFRRVRHSMWIVEKQTWHLPQKSPQATSLQACPQFHQVHCREKVHESCNMCLPTIGYTKATMVLAMKSLQIYTFIRNHSKFIDLYEITPHS